MEYVSQPIFSTQSSRWTVLVSAPFAVGSCWLLKSIDDSRAEKPDYAVELNATNFESVLKGTPAAYAIVNSLLSVRLRCKGVDIDELLVKKQLGLFYFCQIY